MSGGKIPALVLAILLLIVGSCFLIFGIMLVMTGGSPSGLFSEMGPLFLLIAAAILWSAALLGWSGTHHFFIVAFIVAILMGILSSKIGGGVNSLLVCIALAILALIGHLALRLLGKRKI